MSLPPRHPLPATCAALNLGSTVYFLTVFSDRLMPATHGDATVHLTNKASEPLHDSNEFPEHFEHLLYLLGLPMPSAFTNCNYTDLCSL